MKQKYLAPLLQNLPLSERISCYKIILKIAMGWRSNQINTWWKLVAIGEADNGANTNLAINFGLNLEV